MSLLKNLALGASALALGLAALTAPTMAGQTSDHVDSISLTNNSISGIVTLRNTAAYKHVDAIKIEPTKPNVSISLDGYVACEKPPGAYTAHLDEETTKMYFGTVMLADNQVSASNVLYEKSTGPTLTTGCTRTAACFTRRSPFPATTRPLWCHSRPSRMVRQTCASTL